MQPKVKACPERARLIHEITETHREITNLSDQEVRAVISGDLREDTALKTKLEDPRSRSTRLMVELKEHIERHGC